MLNINSVTMTQAQGKVYTTLVLHDQDFGTWLLRHDDWRLADVRFW